MGLLSEFQIEGNTMLAALTGLTIFNIVVWGILFLVVIAQLLRSIRLVPTQSAFLVERLGKYRTTLRAGFHALLPFLDKVTFMVDLKEHAITVPSQECFTKDEVRVAVDGVLYMSVIDPQKACYGVTDYKFAAIQLAQTTTRSVIGTIELDRTFEERDLISNKVVETLSEMNDSWGVAVHRYEISNISPPSTVQDAMEKQVSAERERKAVLAQSEGKKMSCINRSEGAKMRMINKSEGEAQRRINEAEGQAQEILALAKATAESIEKVAEAISHTGGENAMKLQLSEKYLQNFQHLATENTNLVLPADLTQVKNLLTSAGINPTE
jgi:regulator of protease activity HflC (stomatin/prohibitin superfamily)